MWKFVVLRCVACCAGGSAANQTMELRKRDGCMSVWVDYVCKGKEGAKDWEILVS